MITAADFEAALEKGVEYTYTNWKNETHQYTLDGADFWSEAYDQGSIEIPEIGTVKHIDGAHGGAGSGEHIWQVWQVGDGESAQYFMKTGYYMSYDGSNWDGDLIEVEPFEKTVTDWKSK